ncbi:MAG: hypothetical protein JSU81_05935 [Candidatus Coatesbacteria bacterium]|nr:MAG: hypothetical protein JSU81_05935 [Candidatus Coatesbacteria bacterium]
MSRPLPLLAATTLALSLAACTTPEKEPASAETASTVEAPPTIETLAAPRANVDLRWEEWAPVGVASARLDWPAGAAWAQGKLYLVGTRKLRAPGVGRGPRAEIVLTNLSPRGAEEVADFPSRFAERAEAALAASPDNRLWLVGGNYTPPPINLAPEGRLDYTELGTPVGEVYAWSPGADDLKLETFLPVPRGEAAAFFYGGDLYVVAGLYDAANPDDVNNLQVHKYEPAEGLWTKYHDLPVPLAGPAAAVARGGLYVIGGKQLKPAFISNAVFRYDLEVFKWQRLPSAPAPRMGARAYVVGGHLYLLGGCEAEGLGTPARMGLKTYRLDVEANRWEELATPLPEGTTLTAYDGSYFYVVGVEKTYRGRLVKAP